MTLYQPLYLQRCCSCMLECFITSNNEVIYHTNRSAKQTNNQWIKMSGRLHSLSHLTSMSVLAVQNRSTYSNSCFHFSFVVAPEVAEELMDNTRVIARFLNNTDRQLNEMLQLLQSMSNWARSMQSKLKDCRQTMAKPPTTSQSSPRTSKNPHITPGAIYLLYYYQCYQIPLISLVCSVRTASYGPSFFLPFIAQARSARVMKTRKEKTRIHNLPYGPSKRG